MRERIAEAKARVREYAAPFWAVAHQDELHAAESSTPRGADILQLKVHLAQKQPEEGNVTTDLATPLPTLYTKTDLESIYTHAMKHARECKSEAAVQAIEVRYLERDVRRHELERYKMLSWAISCLVIFLVGAPLGAIIKKGGLGVPFLIATVLIVWHYMFDMLGERWAIAGIISTLIGAWLPNMMLLPFAVFFLYKAYKDARLLEYDFYVMLFERTKKYITTQTRKLTRQ